MKKNLFSLFVIFVLSLILSACGSKEKVSVTLSCDQSDEICLITAINNTNKDREISLNLEREPQGTTINRSGEGINANQERRWQSIYRGTFTLEQSTAPLYIEVSIDGLGETLFRLTYGGSRSLRHHKQTHSVRNFGGYQPTYTNNSMEFNDGILVVRTVVIPQSNRNAVEMGVFINGELEKPLETFRIFPGQGETDRTVTLDSLPSGISLIEIVETRRVSESYSGETFEAQMDRAVMVPPTP
jgi:hypothetical protein